MNLQAYGEHAPHNRPDDDDAELARGTRMLGRVLLGIALVVAALVSWACL